MFVFDQLKREDPALRLVAFVILGGLLLLFTGLWWTQVVHHREYQSDLQTQSNRSIRVPAPRGKIVDRNGVELANNQPVYNVSLYLEDMRGPFQQEYQRRKTAIKAALSTQRKALEQQRGRELTKEEAKPYTLTYNQLAELGAACRYAVASNVTARVGAELGVPVQLDPGEFVKHYAKDLYVPMRILRELSPELVARFEERFSGVAGLDLDVESRRVYPHQNTAAHVLGYLRFDDRSVQGEEAYYSYRLPDYGGLIGIEGGFDDELRGHAGGKWVLVNNLGYRQEESFWQPTLPGNNVALTIDLRLQQAAEQALRKHEGANTRGAIVVMDVRNGDLLALASSPNYNPNHFMTGFSPADKARLRDQELKPEFNRTTQDIYQPGSIFKIVVGMAALELGLDPNDLYTVEQYPGDPNHGGFQLGRRWIKDTVPPGRYNFIQAFARSSNSYYIHCGLQPGVLAKIIELGKKLHLGERANLPTRQESAGLFPSPDRIRSGWVPGDTANLSIGQAQLAVTPLQMAVMISAVANNGTVYWPRLVQRLEPQDPLSTEPAISFEAGRVRDTLDVSPRTLRVLHEAMLADVETPEGSGKDARLPNFKLGGKTGTAQVTDTHNRVIDHITWFASYGPWESPRYAVIVMIEGGKSGGGTCAPLAKGIYETIQKIEQGALPLAALTHN